jgi:hypothetical protein
VVIVKVDNGRLCGGFCSIGWNKSPSGIQYDNKSFLFSLDSLKKYNESLQGYQAHVGWYTTNGPTFGDRSLSLVNTTGFCEINKPVLTVPGDSQGKSEITGMKDTFKCADIEVF